MCDDSYSQSVPTKHFMKKLLETGIALSKQTQQKLISVLDEDMEENISRREYYNALEAY